MALIVGIDAGGTYTDAVLMDHDGQRVLRSAKALTTRHNLALGIAKALGAILDGHAAEIGMVSLSTTLATNALVEGRGSRVATLLIGYADYLRPDLRKMGFVEGSNGNVTYLQGGHDADGEERHPLDTGALRAAIADQAPSAAAFAISGYFGTRNPSHEIAARKLVQEMTGLPVTCGHELTHRLNAVRRAHTVTLNAHLIPLICRLIDAVRAIMARVGIAAPLMVVKGDGSLMRANMAMERPIETVLSGPAASIVGARHLVDQPDVVVIDVGGTTTDIAQLRRGAPLISESGAQVGGRRTMVSAASVHTEGIGGDSEVWRDEGQRLRVGPRRVVPLALLGQEYPKVVSLLREQLEADPQPTEGRFLLLVDRGWQPAEEAPSVIQALRQRLEGGPCSLAEAHRLLERPPYYARYLEQLLRRQTLLLAAITPSDAAHVLGQHSAWSRRAAELGIALQARRWATTEERLCHDIQTAVREQIAQAVLRKLLYDDGHAQRDDGHELGSHLLDLARAPQDGESLSVQLGIRPPLVGVGAPAATYLPQVAHRLGARLTIPAHSEVANAIGAVVGTVTARHRVLVIPHPERQQFRVHTERGYQDYVNLEEALAEAREVATTAARRKAARWGSQRPSVECSVEQQWAPVAGDSQERILLRAIVHASASGRPTVDGLIGDSLERSEE